MIIKSKNWSKKVSHYFDERSDNYDKTHFSPDSARFIFENNRKNAVLSMVINKGELLDSACGTGEYSKYFDNNIYEYYGTDISEQMVRNCQDNSIERVQCSSYESLPFEDGKFDTILCINAFQYCHNPSKALNEMKRVMNEKGEIILTLWRFFSLRTIFSHLFSFRNKLDQIEQRHILYSKSGIDRLLKSLDLSITDYTSYNIVPLKLTPKKFRPNTVDFFNSIETKAQNTFLKQFSAEFVLRIVNKK